MKQFTTVTRTDITATNIYCLVAYLLTILAIKELYLFFLTLSIEIVNKLIEIVNKQCCKMTHILLSVCSHDSKLLVMLTDCMCSKPHLMLLISSSEYYH